MTTPVLKYQSQAVAKLYCTPDHSMSLTGHWASISSGGGQGLCSTVKPCTAASALLWVDRLRAHLAQVLQRRSAPAFTDLMSGQVQFMAESIPQAAQYAKQGRVRALAVTSRNRNPALPDTPTLMFNGTSNAST